MSSFSRYEREAARLAKLPRAQRFEQLMTFPVDFVFKAIGKGEGFWEQVRAALDSHGHNDVIMVERQSAHGRYRALTFTVHVDTASDLDALYDALQALPDLVCLL